jgi:hypothetical protein
VIPCLPANTTGIDSSSIKLPPVAASYNLTVSLAVTPEVLIVLVAAGEPSRVAPPPSIDTSQYPEAYTDGA